MSQLDNTISQYHGHQTSITKRQVSALLDFSFIYNRDSLVFIGPSGVGKTILAIGIGHKGRFSRATKYCSVTLWHWSRIWNWQRGKAS